MAYTDQKMSGGKVIAIVIVALIHAALGYAFVTGLAYQYVKKAAEKLNTFDVEEPPPPPRKCRRRRRPISRCTPPPVVTPPPMVQIEPAPPVIIQPVPTPPPVYMPTPIAAPPAPPPPPAPPVVTPRVSRAIRAGSPNDDYPSAAMRAEEQGTSRVPARRRRGRARHQLRGHLVERLVVARQHGVQPAKRRGRFIRPRCEREHDRAPLHAASAGSSPTN